MARAPQNPWIRIASHLAALTPLFWLAADALRGGLGANPIQKIEQRLGVAALILLLGSLSITPLVRWARANWSRKFKRRWGVYAFFYACLHLITFVGVDYGLNLRRIGQTLAEKPFLWAGLAAFIILLALAVTSFGKWKQRLGKNWKRLHRLVYAAGVLAVVHFFLASKGDALRLRGDLIRPMAAGALLLILLVLRLPQLKHIPSSKISSDENKPDRV
ncbi:MAG: protein-methionine-sulfoxide reductase heme-binding subunit MsrQ [Anaerolineaceae bacterium]